MNCLSAFEGFFFEFGVGSLGQEYEQSMFDSVLSLITILYFWFSHTKTDPCFNAALFYNILHLGLHLFMLLPILPRLCKYRLFAKAHREYVKALVMSKWRMPIYSGLISILSIACLYSIIAELFYWENFTYLFIVFCLLGSSLTTVSRFVRIKMDCSVFYSLETYKFFNLAIASILFGISAHEPKLSAPLLGMGWAYFLFRSKQSLPKHIVYYLILFMDAVILLTAILVISSSQMTQKNTSDYKIFSNSKFGLLIPLTFFGALFAFEIVDFINMYNNFANSHSGKYEDTVIEFYVKLEQFQEKYVKNIKGVLAEDCSICLENFEDKKSKGERLILNCSHSFHSECLEEWAYLNQTCPICRRSMIVGFEESIAL